MRTVTEAQVIVYLETRIALNTDFSLEPMEGRRRTEPTTNRITAVFCIHRVLHSFSEVSLEKYKPRVFPGHSSASSHTSSREDLHALNLYQQHSAQPSGSVRWSKDGEEGHGKG